MGTRAHRNGSLTVVVLSIILSGCSPCQTSRVPNPKDNLLLIHPGTASSGGVSFARVNAQTLTLGDAQAIERAGQPAVVRVA